MERVAGVETTVVVNPSAGGGATHDVFRRAEHRLVDLLGDFEVAFTDGPGHATVLAREALERGARRILVAGGDGTLHEVVQAFVGEDGRPTFPGAVLALLPGGTGGDFRKCLGIRTLDDALLALASGRTRRIDAGRLAYTDEETGAERTSVFVNIADLGMGGVVVRKVHAFSVLGGKLAYGAATARTLLGWRNPTVRVTLEGGDRELAFEMPVVSVSICNGSYFGGGMHIAPEAVPDDGLFHVVVVGDLRRREVVAISPSIYAGTHGAHPKVLVRTATRVTCESDDAVFLDVDGEAKGRLPARTELLPGVLEVAIP